MVGSCVAIAPELSSAGTDSAVARSKWIAASLTGVSVAPHSSRAWAVAEHSTRSGNQATYVVRSHGRRWSRVKSAGGGDARLLAIAAASPKSIWAVGGTGSSESDRVLIEHSTGGAFRKVKTHFPASAYGPGVFDAVAASSPSNVWAVGSPLPFTTKQPLVAHWNGKTWHAVDDSIQHGYGTDAVSTSGPHNVWILGRKSRRNNAGVWNGHSLRSIPIPTPKHTVLQSIATNGPRDTWVVGWIARHHGQRLKTFTSHWNGKTWKHVAAPSPLHSSQGTSVSAAGKRVYLAGIGLHSTFSSAQTPYLERFVHHRWKLVHTPTRGPSSNLDAVSVSSKGGAAVGFYASKTSRGEPTELPFAATLHGNTWHGATAPR